MTSCSTRELGQRFFVSAGISCIRVSWLPFLRFFIAHGRGLLPCRALDNIERLIPFPRQQSNAAWRPIAAPRNRPATGPSRRKTARRALQAVLPASKMSKLTRRRNLKRDVTPFDGVRTRMLRGIDRCPRFRTGPIRRAGSRRGGLLVRAHLSSPFCDAPLILGRLGP